MELAKISETYNLKLDDMDIKACILYEEKQYVIEFYLEGELFHKAVKRRYNYLDKPVELINIAIKNFMKLHSSVIDKNKKLGEMIERYTELRLNNKVVVFETGEGSYIYHIIMVEKQGLYEFTVTNTFNNDNVHFNMEADSFSDIFEKLTIYVRSINKSIDIFKDNIGIIEKGEYAQKYTLRNK